MFTIRIIDLDKDYQAAFDWWHGHGWPAIPREMLPKLGLMVENDGAPCAVAWLYMDNSTGVSMMEWTVTNPANSPRDSYKAIQILVGGMRECAAEHDYGIMLTSTRQPALVRAYEKAGFIKTDEGLTHLVMNLSN